MWQSSKEISYHCKEDSDCISIIPGLELTNLFWEDAEQEEAELGAKTLERQLAIHGIRLRPSLKFQDWSGHLRLECPEEYCMEKYNSTQLPAQHVELAAMGRLMDWKLCTVELYSGETWLHFYNVRQNEWQTGILYDADEQAETGRELPPKILVLLGTEGKIIVINRDSGGDEAGRRDSVEISYYTGGYGSDEIWRKVRLDSKGGKKVTERIGTNTYKKLFKHDET